MKLCEICKKVKTSQRSVIFGYGKYGENYFVGFKCQFCFENNIYITCEKQKKIILSRGVDIE